MSFPRSVPLRADHPLGRTAISIKVSLDGPLDHRVRGIGASIPNLFRASIVSVFLRLIGSGGFRQDRMGLVKIRQNRPNRQFHPGPRHSG